MGGLDNLEEVYFFVFVLEHPALYHIGNTIIASD